jgi:hypothetical protein
MACRLVALCMTLLLQQHTLPGLPFRPRSPDWLKMKNPGLCGGEAGSGRGLEPIAKNPRRQIPLGCVLPAVCVLLRIGAAPGGWRGPDLHTGGRPPGGTGCRPDCFCGPDGFRKM